MADIYATTETTNIVKESNSFSRWLELQEFCDALYYSSLDNDITIEEHLNPIGYDA